MEFLSDAWAKAIPEYEAAQLSSGLSPATVYTRINRLRALVESAPNDPWSIGSTEFEEWLSTVENQPVSPATKKSLREVIRSFYAWAIEVGHTPKVSDFKPQRRVYDASKQWKDALVLFETAMRAAGNSSSTIELRLKHVSRFASSTELFPWDVTYEDLRGWLDTLECSRATVLFHRSSLRAFYRWAFKTGRVFNDPAEEPSQRAKKLEAPANWAPEITSFRSFLRASGKPETTVGSRVNQINRFARENASLNPWEVTLDDLIEWLSGKRWAAETRRGHRAALRAFYTWAVDTGRIDKSPAERLPVAKASLPRPRPALDAEYELAVKRANEREVLALRLAAELGLRRTEVVSIHTKDLLESDGFWSLVVHGKGNKERVLPLPKGLATLLMSRPEGFIFPGQYNGHLSPNYMGKVISGLLPKCVTMHALRHRFATKAYNIDRDVFTVQQLLGHASPETTQRYVQVSDISMRRLVEAVQA